MGGYIRGDGAPASSRVAGVVLVSDGSSCLCSLCIGEVTAWRTSGSIMMKPRRCANTPRHDQPKERLMSTEYWQPVEGYEGLYEVSDQGKVKGPKGLVKPKLTNTGYQRTDLWRQGERWRPLLHRLVATTFIPNLRQCSQVNHMDGVKTNNAVSNLEWCTPSENALHAVALRGLYGENVSAAKLSEHDVIAIRVMLNKGLPGIWLANVFGVTNTQITHIRKGHHWRHINKPI